MIYEIWLENSINGNDPNDKSYVGASEGKDFHDACRNFCMGSAEYDYDKNTYEGLRFLEGKVFESFKKDIKTLDKRI